MTMEYPRPDFQRSSLNWTSLNGPWSSAFDDTDAGLSQSWPQTGLPASQTRPIKVPYAFQAPASGIGLREAHEVIWYERTIRDIRLGGPPDQRLILRFGAVDYECSIWLDGVPIGGHTGGHVPFDLDLTDAFRSLATDGERKETARLTLRVRDSPTDLAQPRGKQYWGPVPESIFYTPSSGIWQSVWLESVPSMRIGCSGAGTVLRSDDITSGTLHAVVAVTGRQPVAGPVSIQITASLGGKTVSTSPRSPLTSDKEYVRVDLDVTLPAADRPRGGAFDADGAWHDNGTALWAPEHPILYDIVLRLYDVAGNLVDEVQTTTGMRSLSWQNGDGTFRLNNKPYFQMLVLDQGYWPETGLTPPSGDALRTDIELVKRAGFNGCRKHQKIEDPLFLYWADRLGFMVWGEIANGYEYSHELVERITAEWADSVRRDRNHPSVVTWTPGNESWGYPSLKDDIEQRDHIRCLYYLTKSLDPSRPINDNCGWEHVQTDLTTYHDYSDSAQLTTTCADFENGILGPKDNGHRAMFVEPVTAGSVTLDPGAKHAPGAPVICSEFGGVNIKPPKDVAASDRDWGYTTASNAADFLVRLEKLVMGIVKGGFTCGLVYTQLCDVEQEVNGLYAYDRSEKVPPADIKVIMDAAKDYYFQHVVPKSKA
ncbi:glycoside hydrolase family 2 protein [Aspergillus candidus]|uniref:Glycoside hydrolase family 2 protein n=1 Tax=Aspergillus candidus TaxID=41067 RepID=A0A2I2F104_ASPCN|nr:glycoside hydrolase family 2 protein [Aspergillus candidus]PLB34305.1 glycoside hydrolase family 2 protein [Aspergillus candidus]